MDNRNIRGLAFLLPISLLVMLIVIFAKPKPQTTPEEIRKPQPAEEMPADSLFRFDPNTADYYELRALGLSQVSAAAVIKRQKQEWPFSVKEELATIRGIDDSLYRRLEPYIVIADRFRAKPRYRKVEFDRTERKIYYQPFRIDTASVAYLSTIGFSVRQAQVIVNYRDKRGGFYSIDEFAECYVVDKAVCDTLARYIIFPERENESPKEPQRIEINTADSAALRSVFGIGEKSVTAILAYRRQLGGFYDLRQLAEIKTVTESNFEKILTQIYCDSCKISKIDINFAPSAQLQEHPYIEPRQLRKLLKQRQLKGGWSKIEEMIDDNIFTEKEAERLRPYLRFTRNAE